MPQILSEQSQHPGRQCTGGRVRRKNERRSPAFDLQGLPSSAGFSAARSACFLSSKTGSGRPWVWGRCLFFKPCHKECHTWLLVPWPDWHFLKLRRNSRITTGPTHPPIHPPTLPSTHPSIYQTIHPPTHPSIHLPTGPTFECLYAEQTEQTWSAMRLQDRKAMLADCLGGGLCWGKPYIFVLHVDSSVVSSQEILEDPWSGN